MSKIEKEKQPELDRETLLQMMIKGFNEGQKEMDELPVLFPGGKDGIIEVLDEP